MNPPGGTFPTTKWTEIAVAAERYAEGEVVGRDGFGTIVERYLHPLRVHLLSRWKLSPEDAQDHLQAFLCEKVFQRKLFSQADRERGRFRTFLLNALENFVVCRARYDNRQKRAPLEGLVPLDGLPESAAGTAACGVSQEFDRAWARRVLEQTLESMEKECEASARPDIWRIFRTRLLDPIIHGQEPLPYDDLVREFGFQSPLQAANVLTTAKRMFVRCLRATVAEYAPDQIDEEIQELQQILAGG